MPLVQSDEDESLLLNNSHLTFSFTSLIFFLHFNF